MGGDEELPAGEEEVSRPATPEELPSLLIAELTRFRDEIGEGWLPFRARAALGAIQDLLGTDLGLNEVFHAMHSWEDDDEEEIELLELPKNVIERVRSYRSLRLSPEAKAERLRKARAEKERIAKRLKDPKTTLNQHSQRLHSSSLGLPSISDQIKYIIRRDQWVQGQRSLNCCPRKHL